MKPRETVCFTIKTCWQAISRFYNEQAAEHELTAPIGYVLLNIDQAGISATRIGPMVGMEASSLTRMLKSLEEKALIYKEHDCNDKRLVKIFLTEKGREKKEVAKKVVRKFNQTVRESIPKEKLEVFFEVIEKINSISERS